MTALEEYEATVKRLLVATGLEDQDVWDAVCEDLDAIWFRMNQEEKDAYNAKLLARIA